MMNIHLVTQRILRIYNEIHNRTVSSDWHFVHLRKDIKTRYKESYLNILDFFLLTYALYSLVANYLIAKAER